MLRRVRGAIAATALLVACAGAAKPDDLATGAPAEPTPEQPTATGGTAGAGVPPGGPGTTSRPESCPAGTLAVLVEPQRCAPCAAGSAPCPCVPAAYRCEPQPPARPPAPGPSCGAVQCQQSEICCLADCSGQTTCALRACPPVQCPRCPPGTCRMQPNGACDFPRGPLGSGCCGCGDDGMCNSFCRCAAPETPIATPQGERPIGELAAGDLVMSVDDGVLRAVPIARVHRAAVREHFVVRVELEGGRELAISPGHPTADGRLFRDLRPGDRLGEATVIRVSLVPYEGEETVDILPRSSTGTYVAAGALVGSTLAR